MNQQVVFSNPGVIDVRSIKTFGVSVKENKNPIGYFGTGLKYAIAILLRHGQQVEIYAGIKKYVFTKKPTDFRGKEFDLIMMNDEEMPFTTELGKNWELWQAFREIYCNCLDESGVVGLEDVDQNARNRNCESTYVVVTGAETVLAYHDRDNIVLRIPSALRVGEGKVEIYNKPSDYLYYRSIRVLKLPVPSLMTYNILEAMKLTEDRGLETPSMALIKIVCAIALITDKDVIRNIITTQQKCFEMSSLEYPAIGHWEAPTSAEFDDVVEHEFKNNNDKLHTGVRLYYKNKMNKGSTKSYVAEEMNDVEKKQLARCLEICHKSFRDFEEHEILVVKTLGESTMAVAEPDAGRMVLSRKAFAMGTKFLLSTIIEEFAHIQTGHHDMTREFQTHIFDRMCSVIEDHVIKEPV